MNKNKGKEPTAEEKAATVLKQKINDTIYQTALALAGPITQQIIAKELKLGGYIDWKTKAKQVRMMSINDTMDAEGAVPAFRRIQSIVVDTCCILLSDGGGYVLKKAEGRKESIDNDEFKNAAAIQAAVIKKNKGPKLQ